MRRIPQDARLSLVHIPLAHYPAYLQPLLRLIFPASKPNGVVQEPSNLAEPDLPWVNRYPFLNVSVTSTECSIVCPKALAEELFAPSGIAAAPRAIGRYGAIISPEDFVVMSVEGEGLEAGKRVLELTSPLALAGM